MSLTLTNIPTIMRAQGWTRGATLMSKWLAGPPAIVPHYASTDTSTIRMRWVLGYRRPRELYDSIFDDQIWANEAARGLLRKRLVRWGKLGSSRQTFDQTMRPPSILESEYINYRSYGGGYSGYSGYYGSSGYSSSGYSGSVDRVQAANNASGQATGLSDLVAALGAFNFRVVLAGSVTPTSSGQYQVEVTKVGVYLRDSFDFEGFQFLGFWDDSDNSVSAFNPFSGTAVYNSTFRDYRSQNNNGGDMLVFSDVLVTTLHQPHTFTL